MGFMESIEEYPEMILDAAARVNGSRLPEYSFNSIIVCGMGGSAIGGDLLRDLLRDTCTIQVDVSRQYHLPAYADEDTLVFCVSYSGNTEETLSQFVGAVHAGCKTIAITSGGKLEEWSKRLELPHIRVPEGHQPRAALPYLLVPMVVYLQNLGLINLQSDLEESVDVIKSLTDKSNLDAIAESLLHKQIAVYASCSFTTAAKRMKTQLNENAKIPARYAVFPELNHNEIVGYGNDLLNERLAIIMLRDRDEPKELRVRIDLTKQLIGDRAEVREVWSNGRSKLAKMFELLYKTDYLSAKLAELYNVDTDPVTSIGFLKRELRERLSIVEKLENDLIALNLEYL